MSGDSLQFLQRELGCKNTYELLAFSLPILQERKNALFESLQKQDWSRAANIAHQTCGSVRMYGSTQLETLLRVVSQRNVSMASDYSFQRNLENEMNAMLAHIQRWLEEQRTD